jgi:hypothetical protein
MRKISCFECEPLLSKACDCECSPLELELIKEHLKHCPECRKTLVEFRDISIIMSARLAAASCPPVPSVRDSAPFALRLISSPLVKRYAFRAAAAAVCAMFFLTGHFVGTSGIKKEIAKNASPVAVATPSMWAARTLPGAALAESLESEQPFTDSISQYRLTVGQELRKNDVDWLRVRELVEAIGELRTDLELLTIHMAYLEIRTGNSPNEVAERWDNLAGVVYK